jgi:multidrug efflux pump subunit AcrB
MIAWAVRRPAIVWATSTIVLLGGIVAFTRLALATRTSVELPRLQISATWFGASAELSEMYLASPIEAAVQSVRGVKKTSSESTEDGANLTIELEPNADVQIARLAILERLELLRAELPAGVLPPRVSNFVPQELEEEPLLRFTLSGPYTSGALQKIAEDDIQPRLAAVEGVAGIEVRGGTEIGVTVSYDPSLLRQLGLSPDRLGEALSEARMVRSLGLERQGSASRAVSLRDQPNAIEQLSLLPIRGPGNRVFRLGELANVRPDEDSRGFFFRIDGQPAIALAVSRLAGADAIKTAAALRTAAGDLKRLLPPRVSIDVVSDESVDLNKQLRDLLLRGSIAFVAVLLVIALMLHDARAVALVMGSAALAVAGTALGLYLLNVPANMLTLAGLAMGIGILVQNGLVVAERLGTAPDTVEGRVSVATRIAPAVLGATLTTAVVLFPFLYLQGDARAAFVPFASAFTLALGCSVVSSLVMIPALAAGHKVHESAWPRSRRAYARMLMPMLRWRWITLGVTVIALGALTWVFVKRVPRFAFSGFGEQRTTIQASLSFPRGSDPASLDAALRELERVAVRQPGVERVVAQSYGTFAAGMQVLFTRAAEFSSLPQELEERLVERAALIGGVAASVRGNGPGFSSGFGGASAASFRLRILGYSFAGTERIANDLKQRLEQISRVREVNISTSAFFGREKTFAVTIAPDRDALARHGVTGTAFAQALAREVRGPIGRQLLEIGGDEIPVTVKVAGARERSLEELKEAIVPTPSGDGVRLDALARVDESESLGNISRQDQQYLRILSYDFRGPAKLAQRTHTAFMKSIAVPAGYTVEDAGFGFYVPDESEKGLWLVFAIGVVLVILSVALVFDSIWAAAMVFLSLPVALGGVMLAFWVAKASFTREAAVGVILVVGLAVNQSILLVDAALERRRARRTGLLSLGGFGVIRSALDRSGMIVLVTLTSLASLLPLAIGTDTNSLFGAIALATAGGTLAGTIGAMFVLPAMVLKRRSQTRSSDRATRVSPSLAG